ncbi:TetR/AcrR family transcriptional regulator [Corynebacterium crudilactis]|uniref:TetR family transcriptional regulator n=1 Tax=Corynebacterium crudilactis TaxID=1652495 RepID=A0A172QR08_9CORY|nr:TetR/AcrR family transcriptional regulator [Corynebacterium crudilactis]ANE03108.1 TetR family transcriptional regulator [Corynebacterium crudilactis]
MDIEEQPSLREIKRQKTLEAIEDNATRLILERGFDNVTVEDICAEAGISKRTFFNYVESKEIAAIGRSVRFPEEQEREDFLSTQHEDVLETAFDLVVKLFGNHDSSTAGIAGVILRRRKEIRSRHPQLALQHFATFHQARAELEELLSDYFVRWPNSQRLDDPPKVEAIAIIGVLITSMFQGSREWHEKPGADQNDFRDCCQKALNNIFLLKGGAPQ